MVQNNNYNGFEALKTKIEGYLIGNPEKDSLVKVLDPILCSVKKGYADSIKNDVEGLLQKGFPKELADEIKKVGYKKGINRAYRYGIYAAKNDFPFLKETTIEDLKRFSAESGIGIKNMVSEITHLKPIESDNPKSLMERELVAV